MIAAWNRFWFAPGRVELVALMRIYVGGCLLMKKLGLWGLHRVDQIDVRLRFSARGADAYVGNGFRDPVFDWVPRLSLQEMYALDQLQLVGALLLTVGLGTRVVAPALAALHLFFILHSNWTYVHHNNVYAAFLVLLAFAPAADHYSLDALLRKGPAPPRRVTSLRLMQVLVCAIYFSTTFGKLNHGWLSGRMMEVLEANDHFRGPFAPTLWAMSGPKLVSHFTLWAEGICSFGLCFPQTRLLAAFSGVMLHTGIDMMMPVTTFSYQMMSSYVLFLDPEPRRTHLCAPPWLAWTARGLDWAARLTVTTGPLAVTTPDGRAFTGLRALREVGLRLPLTFPAAFALGLPFTLWGRNTRRGAIAA